MVKIKKCELNPSIKLMDRNNKSKKTETAHFMLWNLPSIKTCPYATELCKKRCFGAKQENGYNPVIISSRANAYAETLKPNFVKDMIKYIEWYLQKRKVENKTCFLRIHGTGDFYSLEYMRKWIEITDHFKGDNRIVFQCYTKSMPFLIEILKERSIDSINIKIVWSIFDDTDPFYTAYAKELGLTTFTAKPKKEIETAINDGYFLCQGNCGNCKACYKGKVPKIVIPYH